MELFDICDEQGNPTGDTVERSEAHAKGICHRTAHIWIAKQENGRYKVLLQKRSMDKDSFPGRYDTSSAGHIQAGDEPMESALRELGEELGIKAEAADLDSREHSGSGMRRNFMAECSGTTRWHLCSCIRNRWT